MSIRSKPNPKDEKRSPEFLRIGIEAIRQAREENRRLGLPNVGERDGRTILEMPDGTVVVLDSEKKRERGNS